MTPDELLRERKRRELLARANDAGKTKPSAEEALVSDNAKQSLRAAGHWAGVLGKRAVEVTKQGASIAADKAKLAAAAASEKTREAQAAMATKRFAAQASKSSSPAMEPPSVVEPSLAASVAQVSHGATHDVAAVTTADGEPASALLERMDGEDSARALEPSPGAAIEVAATPPLEPEVTIDPATAPLPEDPMGELPPLPDDAYSEEATQTDSINVQVRSRRRWIATLLVVVVVGVGLTAFAWLGRDKASEAAMPASTPARDVSVSLPGGMPTESAVDTAAPSEPKPVEPERVQPEAIQSAGGDAALPPEAVPSATSQAEPIAPTPPSAPAPVARPAAAAPEARPVQRRTMRAAAPAPPDDTQWQRQADADLDAWAKRAGLD